MTFEWDENKNLENIEKHGVSFKEAQEAFFDENGIIREDEEHSLLEERYFFIGRTPKDILTVRFTERNNNIRIFGAGYWRKQKKYYEQENNLL
ncbi:MAG: BrnT family toxin [Prevotellaceae bacterium]|jgi:uncharacterized DUF497 family protein|nr:BrnT family toxin [Prevotellaceae bacterium]